MRKAKITAVVTSLMLLGPLSAFATPVSISEERDITQDGQSFNILFTGLPSSDGTGGIFSFYADGDFTTGVESARVRLDFGNGSLRLNENGVVWNTISGLSLLANNTQPQLSTVRRILDFQFYVSGPLLDSLLANNQIRVRLNNSYFVDDQAHYRDFMRVGFEYSSVPEPTTMALFGLGLVALGFASRRRTRRIPLRIPLRSGI
jgi:hypothetical protein